MTTWVVEAPYAISAAEALEALQLRILGEASYSRPWIDDPARHADALIDAFVGLGLYDELLAEMAGLGRADTFDRLREGAEPRDRVEAVLWSGVSGTGSVLDVEVVEPLGRTEVLRLFGEVHPDVEVIRANETILHEVATPDGQYLVAYTDGLPAALFFFGGAAG